MRSGQKLEEDGPDELRNKAKEADSIPQRAAPGTPAACWAGTASSSTCTAWALICTLASVIEYRMSQPVGQWAGLHWVYVHAQWRSLRLPDWGWAPVGTHVSPRRSGRAGRAFLRFGLGFGFGGPALLRRGHHGRGVLQTDRMPCADSSSVPPVAVASPPALSRPGGVVEVGLPSKAGSSSD